VPRNNAAPLARPGPNVERHLGLEYCELR